MVDISRNSVILCLVLTVFTVLVSMFCISYYAAYNNQAPDVNTSSSNVNAVHTTPTSESDDMGADDCWWTGCQLNSWAVTGCDSYGRIEKAREVCDDGLKYRCCKPVDSGVRSSRSIETQSVRGCGKRLVGYYTSWSDKTINGQMLEKLTHVIYAFLEMHEDGSIDLGPSSPDRLQQLMDLAKSYPDVKVLYAVGGASNSQYFSQVLAAQDIRTAFVSAMVEQVKTHGFDGVDIDWEFPASDADKSNFVLLTSELRQALNAASSETGRVYLISFAGSAGKWALDPGFDLPGLLEHVDFVNAMTYDYYGAWGSEWGVYTGPPAPLYYGAPSSYSTESNADWTIQYYTEKSQQPDKINMGVPFYGPFWNNVGDPVDGTDGMWRKAEMVDGVVKGGAVNWNKIQTNYLSDSRFQQFFHDVCKAPYAWNAEERTFLGYENPASIEFKVQYATAHNLGGMMIWAIDLDDDELTLLNSVYKVCLSDESDPMDDNNAR